MQNRPSANNEVSYWKENMLFVSCSLWDYDESLFFSVTIEINDRLDNENDQFFFIKTLHCTQKDTFQI